jgi:hypothetical protein
VLLVVVVVVIIVREGDKSGHGKKAGKGAELTNWRAHRQVATQKEP